MSYILDALTKSEQERTRGSVPDLHTVQVSFPLSGIRSAGHGRYLIVTILVAAAAAGGGWMHARNAPVREPPSAVRPQPAQAVAASVPAPAASAKVPRYLPAERSPKQAEKTERSVALAPAAAPAPSRAPEPPPQKIAGTLSAVPADDRVINPNELPPELQKQLPGITISGFADAPGSGRMVVINGRVIQEGDELAVGLKVEEIAPGSVTLRYKGYRIRQPY